MQESASRTLTSAENPSKWPLLLGLFGIFGLIAVAAFLPQERLWGINHLSYYSVAVRIGALVLMAATLIPVVGRLAYSLLASLYGSVSARRRVAAFVALAIAVASVLVFYSFQSSTLVLGDGQFVANTLEVTYRADSTAVIKTLGVIAKKENISPGTTTLYYLASTLSDKLFRGEPLVAIRFLNCLLGGVFVLVLLAVAWGAGSLSLAVWLLLLSLSCGAMQLFFGYVENYTPQFLLGSLYVISGIRLIHGKGKLWIPILCLVVGVCLHVHGVLLAASLVLLFAWRFAGRRRNEIMRWLTPTLILLILAGVYVAAAHTPLSRFFLPLFPTGATYSVFSARHVIDIANEILLLMPVFPLILVMGLWVLSSRGSRSRPTEYTGSKSLKEERLSTSQPTPWLTQAAEWHFVALIVVPAAIYLLFFNPEIGLGRDWDLFSILSLGLIPLSLLIVNRFFTVRPSLLSVAALPSLVMGVTLNVAWIGINASPTRSTDRFEHILAYEENRPDYAYEVLARAYYDSGRLPEAIRAQEKASRISGNPRHHLALSRFYREHGDIDASLQLLERLVAAHPRYRPARKDFLVTLFARGRVVELVEVSRQGIEYNSQEPFYHYYLGKGLLRLGQVEQGRLALLESKRLNPDPLLRKAIEEELQRVGSAD